MRIITINLNGIRSANRKGFFTWIREQDADVICMQELKAQEVDLADAQFAMEGYTSHFHCAEKKGYSGVAIYTRHQPNDVISGLAFDAGKLEGRYVAIKLGQVWIASLYMPSGTSGEIRQAVKFAFLESYGGYLRELIGQKEHYIICGDWNIAHKQIDLKNWRSNQKHSGFLPEERAWMDTLFDEIGFVDAFRVVNQEPDQYTWWSNRGRAREKNVGWRIDYQIVSPTLKPLIKSATIYTGEKFSDHAPLIMDYDINDLCKTKNSPRE